MDYKEWLQRVEALRVELEITGSLSNEEWAEAEELNRIIPIRWYKE